MNTLNSLQSKQNMFPNQQQNVNNEMVNIILSKQYQSNNSTNSAESQIQDEIQQTTSPIQKIDNVNERITSLNNFETRLNQNQEDNMKFQNFLSTQDQFQYEQNQFYDNFMKIDNQALNLASSREQMSQIPAGALSTNRYSSLGYQINNNFQVNNFKIALQKIAKDQIQQNMHNHLLPNTQRNILYNQLDIDQTQKLTYDQTQIKNAIFQSKVGDEEIIDSCSLNDEESKSIQNVNSKSSRKSFVNCLSSTIKSKKSVQKFKIKNRQIQSAENNLTFRKQLKHNNVTTSTNKLGNASTKISSSLNKVQNHQKVLQNIKNSLQKNSLIKQKSQKIFKKPLVSQEKYNPPHQMKIEQIVQKRDFKEYFNNILSQVNNKNYNKIRNKNNYYNLNVKSQNSRKKEKLSTLETINSSGIEYKKKVKLYKKQHTPFKKVKNQIQPDIQDEGPLEQRKLSKKEHESFINKQYQFEKQKNQKIELLKEQKFKKEQDDATFIPKINKVSKFNNLAKNTQQSFDLFYKYQNNSSPLSSKINFQNINQSVKIENQQKTKKMKRDLYKNEIEVGGGNINQFEMLNSHSQPFLETTVERNEINKIDVHRRLYMQAKSLEQKRVLQKEKQYLEKLEEIKKKSFKYQIDANSKKYALSANGDELQNQSPKQYRDFNIKSCSSAYARKSPVFFSQVNTQQQKKRGHQIKSQCSTRNSHFQNKIQEKQNANSASLLKSNQKEHVKILSQPKQASRSTSLDIKKKENSIQMNKISEMYYVQKFTREIINVWQSIPTIPDEQYNMIQQQILSQTNDILRPQSQIVSGMQDSSNLTFVYHDDPQRGNTPAQFLS